MDRNFEHETNTKRPAGFLTGLLLGGVAGAVTALLLAPQSGEDTRHQLQDKAMKLSEQTSATVEDVFSQARTKKDEVKATLTEKAQELKKQGQEALVEQLDRVSNAAESGKKAIQGKES